MRLRKLIAGIHPRLAVVAHDMLMVWLAWTAVSMMRWSLAPNPSPVSLFGHEVWLVLAAQGRDLLVDRSLSRPVALRQPAGPLEHLPRLRVRRVRDRDHAVPLQPPR